MTTTYLERREPVGNRQRFYIIAVTRTLFDQWAVGREWGRIGQPGTVRETGFDTETAALEAGEQWRERKEKRGYRAVGGSRGLWKLADMPIRLTQEGAIGSVERCPTFARAGDGHGAPQSSTPRSGRVAR